METRLAPTDTPAALAAAVGAAVTELCAGNPVALPTETVYGLAADALQPDAVMKIFEAKERPLFDPLIVHLPNEQWLDQITAIPLRSRDLVARLIRRFWPGPLTIVLPRRDNVPDLVTAGLPTVAVRMSAHAVFREVCSEFGRPLAAPSANRFGRISPTTAAHVNTLDGGATEYGLESTIVKVDGSALRLLRAGPITADDFAAVWKEDCEARGHIPDEAEITQFFAGLGVDFRAMLRGEEKTTVEAPGQLASHYAPRTPLRLVSPGTHFAACGGSPRFGSLAFSTPSDAAEFACEEILSPTRDLREAAATLFAKLRRLDEAGLDVILAEPVPETGLGIAIMDRLRKAAAQNVQ